MKINFKNLGPLIQGEFQLGELTIICGNNNTGKTYATYALFGFLSYWREAFSVKIAENKVSELLSEGTVILNIKDYIAQAREILSNGCKSYTRQLPMIFAAPDDRFEDTEFQILLDPQDLHPAETFERRMSAAKTDLFSLVKSKSSDDLVITLLKEGTEVRIPRQIIIKMIGDAIKDIVFGNLFPSPFIASAERTGAAIFRKELNFARNRLLEQMSQSDKSLNPLELLATVYQDYALPVKANVDFTRQLESLIKKNSYISKNYPELLADFANIIGGQYKVTKQDELFYVPKGKNIRLTMDESSSAVRSLLDLGFYLRHVAKPDDLLMVDEPELNLHPENQRRVARLFARLVNLGIKVFITTHSDFMVKEFNTLIMLCNDNPRINELRDKEGYKTEELLPHDKVKVYIAEEASVLVKERQRKVKRNTLTPADIDPKLGIEARSFDKTIDEMNRIQEEIVWGD